MGGVPAGGAAGYGVSTGAFALSASHSFVIAASEPSLLIAAIAAFTHAVSGLPLARTTLACSASAPLGGGNWPTITESSTWAEVT